MKATRTVHKDQRVDRVFSKGELIEEIVYSYPFDGTAVLRRKDEEDSILNVDTLDGFDTEPSQSKRTEIKDLAITIGFNQAFVDRPNVDAATLAAQVKNLTIQINRVLNFIKETQEGKQ